MSVVHPWLKCYWVGFGLVTKSFNLMLIGNPKLQNPTIADTRVIMTMTEVPQYIRSFIH